MWRFSPKSREGAHAAKVVALEGCRLDISIDTSFGVCTLPCVEKKWLGKSPRRECVIRYTVYLRFFSGLFMGRVSSRGSDQDRVSIIAGRAGSG